MAGEAPAAQPLDFERYHRELLPQRLGGGASAQAAHSARQYGSLAFRRSEGGAFTYVPGPAGIEIAAGDASADTLIELSDECWQNVVHELDAAAGLLYGGRARCLRGDAMRWLSWEPALRFMYNDRPVYDGRQALLDRRGRPLDPAATFTLDDDREDLAHFLRTVGCLLVRGAFSSDETAPLLAEARELYGEAVKGDRLSWWGKNARGEEVLCRVTRAAAKPGLAALPADPRLLLLRDLADRPLRHRVRGGSEEGVTVIYKNPDMTEGLSDIPWHRDCGMGGHAVNCPVLIVSLFLTPANPDTGELRFLPGSWDKGCAPMEPGQPDAPSGVSFDAGPGDLTVHYSDTLHVAPPPRRSDLSEYRISAVTGYAPPGAHHHRGEKNYNEVLLGREDGQVEHMSVVARRSAS